MWKEISAESFDEDIRQYEYLLYGIEHSNSSLFI